MDSLDPDPAPLMAEFQRRCRDEGLPVTAQRRFVFRSLAGRTDHPTADQLYDDVRGALPDISRTTVYRVLETLVRIGVARRVNHQAGAARFDANTRRHHHLVCVRCDQMLDFDDSRLSLPLPEALGDTGFTVTDYSIDFRGVCAACRDGKETLPS
jgi:Fur family peroxide stress response transcriptional regulator